MEYCYIGAEKDYINNMRHCQRVADAALKLMSCLVCGGVAVGIAQSCASRLCSAYGVICISAEYSATASVCVDCGGVAVSRQSRAKSSATNLKLSEECYRILSSAEGGSPLEITLQQLRSIEHISAPIAVKASGGAFACAAFCAFFGGVVTDCAACFLTGFVVCMLMFIAEGQTGEAALCFITSVVGGALCIFFCTMAYKFGLDCNFRSVVYGSIMPVIPGLKLCGAIQNIMRGDIRYGAYSLINVLACASAIAAGYALSVRIFSAEVPQYAENNVAPFYRLTASVCGALGFAVMFGAGLKRSVQGAFFAAIGYAVYLLSENTGEYPALFAASAVCSFAAMLSAHLLKIPSAVFLIPAMVPLVPGAALYSTAQSLIFGEMSAAQSGLIYSLRAFSSVAGGGVIAAVIINLSSKAVAVISKKLHFRASKRAAIPENKK